MNTDEIEKLSLGSVCWVELHTQDIVSSGDFYCKLFGWSTEELIQGEKYYYFFQYHGNNVAGMLHSSIHVERQPFWLNYIVVDDVEKVVEHASKMQGIVHIGPMALPQGKFAILEAQNLSLIGIYQA